MLNNESNYQFFGDFWRIKKLIIQMYYGSVTILMRNFKLIDMIGSSREHRVLVQKSAARNRSEMELNRVNRRIAIGPPPSDDRDWFNLHNFSARDPEKGKVKYRPEEHSRTKKHQSRFKKKNRCDKHKDRQVNISKMDHVSGAGSRHSRDNLLSGGGTRHSRDNSERHRQNIDRIARDRERIKRERIRNEKMKKSTYRPRPRQFQQTLSRQKPRNPYKSHKPHKTRNPHNSYMEFQYIQQYMYQQMQQQMSQAHDPFNSIHRKYQY